MFRELSRKNKALSAKECESVLTNEKRGVLSIIGDGGYPYGMPMNHLYKDGCLYFHCGKAGHRIDALQKCSKASFCVTDGGHRDEGEWAYVFKSVIVFGEIEIISDQGTVIAVTKELSRKFTDDVDYVKNEIAAYADKTLILRLTPLHICGKTVTES